MSSSLSFKRLGLLLIIFQMNSDILYVIVSAADIRVLHGLGVGLHSEFISNLTCMVMPTESGSVDQMNTVRILDSPTINNNVIV